MWSDSCRGYSNEVLFILLCVPDPLMEGLFHETVEQRPAELYRIGELIESLEEFKLGRGVWAIFSKRPWS